MPTGAVASRRNSHDRRLHSRSRAAHHHSWCGYGPRHAHGARARGASGALDGGRHLLPPAVVGGAVGDRHRGDPVRVSRDLLGAAARGGGVPDLPRHPGSLRAAGPDRVEAPRAESSPFPQGLFTNLLNPKIAVFYTTFLPQFIHAGDPVLAMSLLLASIHAALSLAWLSGYGSVVARAGDVLRRGRARRALDALSGLVLVGLGMRLALERR